MPEETKVPDWAIERARELADKEHSVASGMGESNLLAYSCYRAGSARYIAANEPEPVDPLMIEAREIVALWLADLKDTNLQGRAEKYRSGMFDTHNEVQQALKALRRGVEIGKGGDA